VTGIPIGEGGKVWSVGALGHGHYLPCKGNESRFGAAFPRLFRNVGGGVYTMMIGKTARFCGLARAIVNQIDAWKRSI
jgi:hypothetical protein